ncbi:MAG: polymer-forming cytoskeletal protein [Rhodocyclaceae bacterium]
MFGKKHTTSVELTKLSSLIADSVEVNGDVMFVDGLRVDGHVRGNVTSKAETQSLLVLSQNGCITGDVHTYDAVINGTIHGNLVVEHFLELQAKAKVAGNITYRQLRMDCGAAVDGHLATLGEDGKQRLTHEAQSNVLELPGPLSAKG